MLKFDFNDKNKLVNKNIFLPNFKKIAKNVSDLLKIKDELTFEVTFVDNKEIKNLNKVYRGKNKATDVISFALLDNEEIKTNLIGEIYICVPFAKAESKKHNWTLNYEINLLFAHGLLHLLGYDHNTKVEEKVMFDLQEKLIKNL